MINKNALLKNLMSKPLMEYTISDLKNMSDPERKGRSKSLTARFDHVAEGPDGQMWTYWNVPSQSEPGKTYQVIVEIDTPNYGGFFSLAKETMSARERADRMARSNVKVYCTCPDFYWSGSKYNLGPSGRLGRNYQSVVPGQRQNYKYDTANVTYPPNVKDPERKHVLCKHILVVSDIWGFNAPTILKQAKNFKTAEPANASVGETSTIPTQEVPVEQMVDITSQTTGKDMLGAIEGESQKDLQDQQKRASTSFARPEEVPTQVPATAASAHVAPANPAPSGTLAPVELAPQNPMPGPIPTNVKPIENDELDEEFV